MESNVSNKENTTMRPKVSIIVPVYNAGKHLYRCLDTLVNQTLKEIEIILILDCPTDGSDAVAHTFAEKYKQIKLIHNETNLRVGLSRNKGLEAAEGEYIGFCDHDDFVSPIMFERLYHCALKTDANIVMCDVNNVENETVVKTTRYPAGLTGKEYQERGLRVLLNFHPKKNNNFYRTVWNHLFKQSFLHENKLQFEDNHVITSDDSLFVTKAYFLTDKMTYCESPDSGFYNHVDHPSNALNSYSFINIELVLNYINKLDEFLKGRTDAHPYDYDIAEGTIRHLYTGFLRELQFKGLWATLHKLKVAKKNSAVYNAIKLLWTAKGFKYAIKELPPTKFLFLCILSCS